MSASSSGCRPPRPTDRARGSVRGAFALGWLLAAAVAVSTAAPTAGATSSAPSTRFLTLPFASTTAMEVQRGWWAGPIYHHAIDYIRGVPNVPVTWQSFAVLAAAPGVACAQVAGRHGCIDIPDEKITNRVAIRHAIGGRTFWTVYEDLRSIAPTIPIGGRFTPVTRGELLGTSGSGEGNPPDLVHLHFEVLDASMQPIDPYDIYGRSSAEYPNPAGTNGRHSGPNRLWINDPPKVPTTARPTQATAATSTASPSPSPTAPLPSPSIAQNATASFGTSPGASSPVAGAALASSPPVKPPGSPLRVSLPLLGAGLVAALAALAIVAAVAAALVGRARKPTAKT